MARRFSGLFVAEGSSDAPLADTVELLFLREGLAVSSTRPDFASLRVPEDVRSRVSASLALVAADVDPIVVHRDADDAGADSRESEIARAVAALDTNALLVPVVPVRTTEAWLLLDEPAIRHVAEDPNGRSPPALPRPDAVERVPDPKVILGECLLAAASVTGRRRAGLVKRFGRNRRQLLERLDLDGPVAALSSWQALTDRVATTAAELDRR